MFVPVDFERQVLRERLRDAGFREDQPAFFSWLGVTMYLTRDAMLSTLRFVAGCAPGGGITFAYLLPPSRLPWLRRLGFWLVARRVARAGEPWTTWFDPDDMAHELTAMGFTRLDELDGPALDRCYFGGREKRVGGASLGRVMTAR